MVNFFKKRWYLVVILITILFIAYQQLVAIPAKKLQKSSYRVKRENLKEVLSLAGKIDAEEKVTLRFQSSGRLVWVGVKEGDYVKKYQTIASLDQRQLKKTLEKYLNSFVKERLDFDQSTDDNWQKQYDLSRSIREEAERTLKIAQYDLNNAVLDVELQNISLEYANLWTPIEGIVTRVDAPFAGVNITPAQAEFEIVNPDTVYFSATVDQNDIVNLKTGMVGDVILDPYPEKPIKGRIDYISFSPKAGETTTSYKVKIIIDNKNNQQQYRLEMTGDADFLIKEKKNVLTAPISFLKTEKNKKYVYLMKNGKRVKAYVIIGEEVDSKVEIVDGLKDGDLVYD